MPPGVKKSHFHLSRQEKEAILFALCKGLGRWGQISFAYGHGSFFKEGPFRDVDVAVYLRPPLSHPLELELALESELAGEIRPVLVDVRLLNRAPVSFRYRVIKEGRPLVVRDEVAMADFVEATIRDYLDFSPFRREYLMETLGLGCQP